MAAAVSETDIDARTATQGGKYLTFHLDSEEYGLEILKVREIIGIMAITAVPRMPAHVKGVINLRGQVIPVIDLRLKFGIAPAGYTDQTCVVVVDVGTLVGVIVDTVQEVLDIDADHIDPPPPLGAGVNANFIMGMGKVKDDVKILLDIDCVLADDDIVAAAQAVPASPDGGAAG